LLNTNDELPLYPYTNHFPNTKLRKDTAQHLVIGDLPQVIDRQADILGTTDKCANPEKKIFFKCS